MKLFTRLAAASVGLLALVATAAAQDDFERGKTGAQLYASDCAICHKSVQRLNADAGGLFGLRGFLTEHYTASREAAASIAAYVESMQRGASGDRRAGARGHSRSEGDAKVHRSKPAEKKTTGGKAEEAKPPAKKDEPKKKSG